MSNKDTAAYTANPEKEKSGTAASKSSGHPHGTLQELSVVERSSGNVVMRKVFGGSLSDMELNERFSHDKEATLELTMRVPAGGRARVLHLRGGSMIIDLGAPDAGDIPLPLLLHMARAAMAKAKAADPPPAPLQPLSANKEYKHATTSEGPNSGTTTPSIEEAGAGKKTLSTAASADQAKDSTSINGVEQA